MHVTILHISTEPKAPSYDDTDVAAENWDKFPDGVEEQTGKDRKRSIKSFLAYLGDSVTTGTKNGVTWIELDRDKAIDIFRKPFDSFLSCVNGLHHHDIRDFATGGHGLGEAIRNLNDAYNFDGFYLCCDCLYAQTVAEWLRCIIGNMSCKTRYYVHETYNGDK